MDVIERQAAMKLLRDDWQASESRGDTERAEIAKFHFIEISNLPAAQPEQHHDEWCTDCKEYDKEKHCCPRWNRVIRQTLQDAQPETTTMTVGRSKGGITMWYECDNCGEPVDQRDNYCPNCGRKFRKNE